MIDEDNKEKHKGMGIDPVAIILGIVVVAVGIVVDIAEQENDNSTLYLIAKICIIVAVVLCCIFAVVNKKRIIMYVIIATALSVLGIYINVFFNQKSDFLTPLPTTSGELTTPSSSETPIERPSSGISSAGSELRDVQYDADGRITRAFEKVDKEWAEWEYVYTEAGAFKYRKRNIGNIDCALTNKFMTGKDITYSTLSSMVENCVGFTLSYSVSNVLHGNYEGEREVYLSSDTTSWKLIGTFEYDDLTRVEIPFSMDYPVTFAAFATPRTHPDDSSFGVNQAVVDVWVADYEYVEIING